MKSYRGIQQKHYQEGLKSEELFCQVTGAVKGTKQDDFNHIDVRLHGKTYDVKGNKACHRKGYVLLEIKNVQGKSGWCSKDGSDKIAFQFDKEFIVVDNVILYRFARNKIIEHHDPKKPIWRGNGLHKKYGYESVLYKCLGRTGREDVFIYVTKDDILKLKEKTYKIK